MRVFCNITPVLNISRGISCNYNARQYSSLVQIVQCSRRHNNGNLLSTNITLRKFYNEDKSINKQPDKSSESSEVNNTVDTSAGNSILPVALIDLNPLSSTSTKILLFPLHWSNDNEATIKNALTSIFSQRRNIRQIEAFSTALSQIPELQENFKTQKEHNVEEEKDQSHGMHLAEIEKGPVLTVLEKPTNLNLIPYQPNPWGNLLGLPENFGTALQNIGFIVNDKLKFSSSPHPKHYPSDKSSSSSENCSCHKGQPLSLTVIMKSDALKLNFDEFVYQRKFSYDPLNFSTRSFCTRLTDAMNKSEIKIPKIYEVQDPLQFRLHKKADSSIKVSNDSSSLKKSSLMPSKIRQISSHSSSKVTLYNSPFVSELLGGQKYPMSCDTYRKALIEAEKRRAALKDRIQIKRLKDCTPNPPITMINAKTPVLTDFSDCKPPKCSDPRKVELGSLKKRKSKDAKRNPQTELKDCVSPTYQKQDPCTKLEKGACQNANSVDNVCLEVFGMPRLNPKHIDTVLQMSKAKIGTSGTASTSDTGGKGSTGGKNTPAGGGKGGSKDKCSGDKGKSRKPNPCAEVESEYKPKCNTDPCNSVIEPCRKPAKKCPGSDRKNGPSTKNEAKKRDDSYVKKDAAKKSDPCGRKDKPKNKSCTVDKKKSDPCTKKGEKKNSNPCAKKDDKKKSDPCAKKDVKKESNPCAKKKTDPCAKKDDKKKTDPCAKKDVKKESDPCAKKKPNPCAKKDSKKKIDPCAKKDTKKESDPCAKKKPDPCAKKDDKKKTDPCAKKDVKKESDPCAKKKPDPCAKKDDKKKTDPCAKKDVKKESDPCAKKKPDSCAKMDNKKKSDPCGKKDEKKIIDPCAKKEKKADPCTKKDDKTKLDPCAQKKTDSKQEKKIYDPCAKKEKKADPCAKQEKKSTDICGKHLKTPSDKQEMKIFDPCAKKQKKNVDPCAKPTDKPTKKCFSTTSLCQSQVNLRPKAKYFSMLAFNTPKIFSESQCKNNIDTKYRNRTLNNNLKSFGFTRHFSSKDKKSKKGSDLGISSKCKSLATKKPPNRRENINLHPKDGLRLCYPSYDMECPKKLCKDPKKTACNKYAFLKDTDNNKRKENKNSTSRYSYNYQEKCPRLLFFPSTSSMQQQKRKFHTSFEWRLNFFPKDLKFLQESDRQSQMSAHELYNDDERGKSSQTHGLFNEALSIKEAYKVERVIKDIPHFTDYDILVSTSTVAISGSDIHVYENGSASCPDITLGHDASGVVVKTGQCITELKPGDRVAMEPSVACGICEFCKRGQYNMCLKLLYNGFFMKYQAHPADLCHKIPDSLSMAEGALSQTLALGCQAVSKANITPTTNILIMGSGPSAVASAFCAHAKGAKDVVVMCTMRQALESMRDNLSLKCIHYKDGFNFREVLETIFNSFNDWPDVVVNCAINEETMNIAAMALKPCGICVLAQCDTECASFNALDVLMKNIQLVPSFRSANMFPTAIHLMSTGCVPISKIISSSFSWDNVAESFSAAQHESNFGYQKVIVECGDTDYDNN